MNTACDQITGELLAEMRDELPAFQADSVRSHLSDCPRCREEREEMGRFAALLEGIADPEPAEDGFDRIVGRIRTSRRRGYLLLLPAAAVAAAALLLALLLPSPPSSPPATVTAEHGRILVAGAPAAIGESRTCAAGAAIRAEAPSRITLESGREIDAVLSAGTVLSFTAPGRLRLSTGRALFAVRPGAGTIEVRTPQATVAVTGTQFDLEVAGNRTTLAVVEGVVEFRTGSGEPVRVVSGQSVAVRGDGPPAPIRKVDPWRIRDWCSRPTLALEASPRRLLLTLENDQPRPLVLKPFDPGSAAYSLRIEALDGTLATSERDVRIQAVMVVHAPGSPEGPDPVELAPGESYRLTIDPSRLALPRGRYRVTAVYKPYKDLPDNAWRGVVESPAREITVD